ncbi:hypothetical protein [Paraclostridium sordellii]|uniref:hypothetical protein n=1 Tax=Paraclostridium sordellii TaxID=1505 RepID=UPI0005E1C5CD|nr:hypothetical protein [Paeniclostridium sordellii]MCQ4695997.1 hypothetical protein [Paeniclostridium sordellii]MDU4412519.1 hypothetical protein [Paeniclostridium sordellii]MDU6483541.1 hypothetical protein [Paeniclostridium sordellii]MRZ29847.1 hypothetical protein [Paeniclostridium sordellii]MVO73855.1 hypothetical protein [Paeniclostridium sordellii]
MEKGNYLILTSIVWGLLIADITIFKDILIANIIIAIVILIISSISVAEVLKLNQTKKENI